MARRVGPYIPQTEFSRKRRDEREVVFSANALRSSWKDAKKILRDIPLTDIFEYHDVSFNLTEMCASISFRIAAGDYESLRNDEFRVEKKDGITRRIVILFPEDAIIFSSINKYSEDIILKLAPTEKSYFVRTNTPKSINDLPSDPYMHWSKLWALFQEEIQGFSGKRKYTVVTDIASYYDTINLSILKDRLQSKTEIGNSVIELIFDMLDRFLWKPEYSKSIFQGLPQVNLPAIRLLANFMLFDVDDYLFSKTEGDFVRWMDDIDFATSSIPEARKVLKDLEVLLNSIGLRLNTGKTRILSPSEALTHFCIRENSKANDLKSHVDNYESYGPWIQSLITDKLHTNLADLISSHKCGAWNKVIARYINYYAKISLGHGPILAQDLLLNEPSLRATLIRYYAKLGYSHRRMRNLYSYILGDSCLDDSSFSEAIDLVIRWKLKRGNKFIKRLLRYFRVLPFRAEADLHRLSNGIKFMMKYTDSRDLSLYIESFDNLWPESEWLSRQVAASYPLLEPPTQRKVKYLIANSGRKEGMRIIHTLERIIESAGVHDPDKSILKQKEISLVKISLVAAYMSSNLSEANKRRLIADYSILEYGDYYIKRVMKKHILAYS